MPRRAGTQVRTPAVCLWWMNKQEARQAVDAVLASLVPKKSNPLRAAGKQFKDFLRVKAAIFDGD